MSLSGVELFKRAIDHHDADELRRVLRENADARAAINEPLFAFDSPAIVTVPGRRAGELLDVLLDFGADPNRKSSWWAGGFHPLYGATPENAEKLIAAGARIDACAASHLDRIDVLEQIFAQSPMRVHERGGDGQSPLHFATSKRMVDFLLDHGADINARCIDHRSTAAEWMIGERTELARYLVERDAHADIFMCAALGLTERARAMVKENPWLMSLRTGQGEYGEKPPSSSHIYVWTLGANLTPLQVAAKFGNAATVDAMEELATPQQQLLVACHRGDRLRAQQLVAQNPGIVSKLGPGDRRALADEAWAANARAVELMLELGFDPSVPSGTDGKGGNALHCAAWEGSPECVSALLNYPSGRALLDSRDATYDGIPLGWCAHGSQNCRRAGADHPAVARLLLNAGATHPPGLADWDAARAVQVVFREFASRA